MKSGKKLKEILEPVESYGEIMPCPGCGVNPSVDCGYLDYNAWDGDYDCLDPDNDGDPCDYCKHLYCSDGKLKDAMEFKKEEFDV